jgi:asparagine synthase (glutamine-hydrolysing)
MSSFFGIFRPQGGPVDLESFEDMRKASYREGFDGMETYVDGKIAMGHLMLRVSPEDQYDKQPLKSSCGRFLLVGHFRLDYRDELGDKIGLTQYELEKTPDSLLAMMAYQKWEEKCVHHIEGDWAFVLFDQKNSSVSLLKDKLGYSAIYYCVIDDQVYFSSDANIFLSIKLHSFQADLRYFQTLFVPELKNPDASTLVKEIKYVNSASVITFSKDLKILSGHYWELSQVSPILYRFEDDCLLNFGSIFSQAVKSRISANSKIGILLSSGLDSNSVASFASKELELRNRELYSYTSCPAYLDMYPPDRHEKISERFMLERHLKSIFNIIPDYLDFKQASFGEVLSTFKKNHVFPLIFNSNFIWVDGITKIAKKQGVDVILTGQLGNFTLSWNAPNYLLYLLMNFRFKEFAIQLNSRITQGDVGIFRLLLSQLINPFIKIYKSKLLYFFSFMHRFSYKKSFLKKHLFESGEKVRSNFKRSFSAILNPSNLRKEIISDQAEQLGLKYYFLGTGHKVNFVDPCADIRVVEHSFSISESYFCKNGVPRYLVRKLMRGLISDEILQNKKAFLQTYDISYRLSNDHFFYSLIEQLAADKSLCEYVDVEKIKFLLEGASKVPDNLKKKLLFVNLLKNVHLALLLKWRNFN